MLYVNYAERLGILTANATTPYMVAFFDLKKSGPMVIELPPGRSRAACPTSGSARASPWRDGTRQGGRWQDARVAPGSDPPADTAGYRVVTNTTVNAMFGLRALDPDPAKAMALVKQVRVYPYSTRANPPPTRLLTLKGKWFGGPPRGMDY